MSAGDGIAPTADEAVASCARIVEAWAHLRLDTDEDQALHDRLVGASRATIAAYVRTRPWSSATAGPRPSGAGDDTAPPAEELRDAAEELREGTMPDLVGTPQDWRDRVATWMEHCAAAGPRAKDTAPDNEPLTFEQAVQHVDWNLNAPRADAAIAALYRGLAKVRELDRLRSDAAALRDAESTVRVYRQEIEDQTARAERAEVEVYRIRRAVQRVVDTAQSVATEASNLGGLDEAELQRRTDRLVEALAAWRSAAGSPATPEADDA